MISLAESLATLTSVTSSPHNSQMAPESRQDPQSENPAWCGRSEHESALSPLSTKRSIRGAQKYSVVGRNIE